jgi:hypothetical protein
MNLLDAIGAVHWRLIEHTRRPQAQVSVQRFAAATHRWPEGVVPCELAGDDLAIAGRALLWLLGHQRDYRDVALPV